MNGNDLMKWVKRNSGPWIRDALEKIEVAVVRGEVRNDKEHIKEWFNS